MSLAPATHPDMVSGSLLLLDDDEPNIAGIDLVTGKAPFPHESGIPRDIVFHMTWTP